LFKFVILLFITSVHAGTHAVGENAANIMAAAMKRFAVALSLIVDNATTAGKDITTTATNALSKIVQTSTNALAATGTRMIDQVFEDATNTSSTVLTQFHAHLNATVPHLVREAVDSVDQSETSKKLNAALEKIAERVHVTITVDDGTIGVAWALVIVLALSLIFSVWKEYRRSTMPSRNHARDDEPATEAPFHVKIVHKRSLSLSFFFNFKFQILRNEQRTSSLLNSARNRLITRSGFVEIDPIAGNGNSAAVIVGDNDMQAAIDRVSAPTTNKTSVLVGGAVVVAAVGVGAVVVALVPLLSPRRWA
jgi:hypothetical protein